MFWILLGSMALYLGSSLLVKGGAMLAVRLKVPFFLIGVLIFGCGTSMPELIVSFQGSFLQLPDLSIGNVLGSNIVNSTFVVGMAALITPFKVDKTVIRIDGAWMLIAGLLVFFLIYTTGGISRFFGCFLLAIFIFYISITYFRTHSSKESLLFYEGTSLRHLIMLGCGFILLLAGGYLFVEGALDIAKLFGFSEGAIGLTIVAFGTSLPEIATACVAAYKKEDEFILGNVIGSNIFNLLVICGGAAVIHPIQLQTITWVDPLLMMGAMGGVWLLFRSGHRVTRFEGATLVFVYIIYTLTFIKV